MNLLSLLKDIEFLYICTLMGQRQCIQGAAEAADDLPVSPWVQTEMALDGRCRWTAEVMGSVASVSGLPRPFDECISRWNIWRQACLSPT